MRLLILPRYSPLGASSRLRMYQYLPALRDAGIEVQVSPLLDDDYLHGLYGGRTPLASVLHGYGRRWRALRNVRDFDVVWVEKEAWPWLPLWLERWLLNSPARLVLDYDDAVFHRYDRHRNLLVRRMLGHKLDRLMQRANLVTVGNEYLAERARNAGCRNVQWLPTVIDLDRYPDVPARAQGGPVVVGWIGTPSTAADYLHLVNNALAPLRTSGLIHCVAIGAHPEQVHNTPFESWPWQERTEVAQLHDLDIGIMPLPDTPWELGKCGYKLIQYMACGLPVVASPVGANTTIVHPGVDGLLAETPEQWTSAIRCLAEDAGLRRRMGVTGRKQIEDTYSLQAQAGRFIDMLRGLAG